MVNTIVGSDAWHLGRVWGMGIFGYAIVAGGNLGVEELVEAWAQLWENEGYLQSRQQLAVILLKMIQPTSSLHTVSQREVRFPPRQLVARRRARSRVARRSLAVHAARYLERVVAGERRRGLSEDELARSFLEVRVYRERETKVLVEEGLGRDLAHVDTHATAVGFLEDVRETWL